MRIFLHGVDTFIGKVIVKELRKTEAGLHRIFGTAKGDGKDVPAVVKRVVSREDPKKAERMTELLRSCKLVIMDLFNFSYEDLLFAIRALKVDPDTLKSTGDLEYEPTFILISSAMVWSHTELDGTEENGMLTDAHYQRRRPAPGSKYEEWRDMEDLVMRCFNQENSPVKAFVIAPGMLYGEENSGFVPLFKSAWLGELDENGAFKHHIVGPGTNRVPTLHVRDLARLVRQLTYFCPAELINEETKKAAQPYLLAVDQPDGGALTQEDIMKGVIGELSEPCLLGQDPEKTAEAEGDAAEPAPAADEAAEDPEQEKEKDEEAEKEAAALAEFREAMSLNLAMVPSMPMLAEDFAAACDPEPTGWWSKEGPIHNIRKVAEEYCKETLLQPMRVIIAGPEGCGKSTLAKAISAHFNIPVIDLKTNLELEQYEEAAEKLRSNVCRYRGFVIDGGVRNYKDCEAVFREEVEVKKEEGEEEQVAEGEEPPPPVTERVLRTDLCPRFVVQMEPSYQSSAYTGGADDEEKLPLTDFFQSVVGIDILYLPAVQKTPEDLFESCRIYMENTVRPDDTHGRPFNFLPSEEEIADEIITAQLERIAEEAERAAEIQRVKDADNSAELEAQRMEGVRERLIVEHQKQRETILPLPLREYLMRYMVPSLTEALTEICRVMPEDPADYLAGYLEGVAKEQGGAR